MAFDPFRKPTQTKSDAAPAHRSAPPRANLTNMRVGMISPTPRHYADGTSNVSPWVEPSLSGPVAAAGGVPPVAPAAVAGPTGSSAPDQGESLLSRTAHAPLDAYRQAGAAFNAGHYAEAAGAGAHGLFATPAAAVAGAIQAAPAVGQAVADGVSGFGRGFSSMVAQSRPAGTAIGGSGAAPQQSALPHDAAPAGGMHPINVSNVNLDAWNPVTRTSGAEQPELRYSGDGEAWPAAGSHRISDGAGSAPPTASATFHEVRPGFWTSQPQAAYPYHQWDMGAAAAAPQPTHAGGSGGGWGFPEGSPGARFNHTPLSINQMQSLWGMQHYDPRTEMMNAMLAGEYRRAVQAANGGAPNLTGYNKLPDHFTGVVQPGIDATTYGQDSSATGY